MVFRAVKYIIPHGPTTNSPGGDELRYTEFSPNEPAHMPLTNQPKAMVLPPRNAMSFDTLAGVRGEMARVYRLGLNGKIQI